MSSTGTWRVGPATALAQLQATISVADSGTGPAKVRIYTTARPAGIGGAAGAIPQAEVVLAKPCATLENGALVLHPASANGAMVMTTGIPRWAEWVSGAGDVVADGSVTDMDNWGDFRLVGGVTPAGEISPLLQAGGLVVLGATTLT